MLYLLGINYWEMNRNGEGGEESLRVKMEVEGGKERLVYMWGYLPGALPQRSPLLSPVVVRLPQSIGAGTSWKDVCGGGCGFAMAISGNFYFLLKKFLFPIFCFVVSI